MTLSSRKCHFFYTKKSGALHYKVSPDNFQLSLATPRIEGVFYSQFTIRGAEKVHREDNHNEFIKIQEPVPGQFRQKVPVYKGFPYFLYIRNRIFNKKV